VTFLAPLLLGAILLAGVPILLHLFHRSEGKPLDFPALRYLHRTAREHARTIRTRQLLLLMLRVAAVVLLALAAARPILGFLASGHPPTALVLVVDNSVSSGAVVDDVRMLDRLRAVAKRSVASALPGDRIWILRAGEPWMAPRPLTVDDAGPELDEIGVGPGAAHIGAALAEALEIAAASGLAQAEIHLFSDLQPAVLEAISGEDLRRDITIVTYVDSRSSPENFWLSEVLVGGGLPPLPGERTQVAFGLERSGGMTSDGPLPQREVRLDAQGRLRGSTQAEPGTQGSMGIGPFSPGWVSGFSELDPDAFRVDDRYYFAFRVREAVAVRVLGDPGPYANEALTVLEDAGRIRTVDAPAGAAQVELLGAGAPSPSGASFVLLPPTDESLLPSVNRGLARAGLGLSYEPDPGVGLTRLAPGGALDLEGLEVARRYVLTAEEGTEIRPLATTDEGDPWLMEVTGADVRALLFASPMDPGWSRLPLSARMIPVLDWALTRWGAGGSAASLDSWTGEILPLPSAADAIEAPDGSRFGLEGGHRFRASQGPGIYTVLAGDSVLDLIAVNVPPGESRLDRPSDLLSGGLLPENFHLVDSAEDWSDQIFRDRRGPEIGWLLLLLAAVVLISEGILAASGPRSGARGSASEDLAAGGAK
jgi:hypothetical protein